MGLVELPGPLRFNQLPADLRAAAEAELLHQAVPGDLRRVRDVGEDRVLMVVLDQRQDLVGERGPERLALGVDLGVVAAREVDPLEGAVPAFARRVHYLDRVAAVRLHDEGVAGR